MAKFKSSAQEGSFKDNQLIVPDQVRKIEKEGQRRLQGMSTAQAHLQKNQEIFLQTQQQAQAIQRESRQSANEINQSNAKAEQKSTADNWRRAIAQEEAKNKSKVDTFKTLAAFSKTAFDITAGIVKENADNQLKAINQVAFKHQLSYKDILNAQSVNSSISNAAWQETNIVKDYIKEGKSQEFINTMYEHLVKGGGYRNYIENSNVLTETARINGRAFNEITNDPSLSIKQKKQAIATLESQQRGALQTDGRIPGKDFLEKFYNPTIRQALSRAEDQINRETRAKTEEKNTNYRISIIDQAAFSSGIFNAPAVMERLTADPRPGAIDEAVAYLKPKLNSAELVALRDAVFYRNGQAVSIARGGYIEANAAIEQALKERRVEAQQMFVSMNEAKQLETRMAMNAKAQQLMDNDGRLTNAEYREILAFGDETYGGPGRDTNGDNFYKRQTVEVKLIPVITEKLEEMRLNKTLSVAELERINPPREVYNAFINSAREFDQVRGTNEYKNIDKYLEERIVGSIKGLSKLKYSDSGSQTDEFNWYVGEQVKIYRKAYMDSILVAENPKEVITVIGDQAATESLKKLEQPGALDYDGIASYNKAMDASTKADRVIQKKVTAWRNLLPTQQQKPDNWLAVIGEKSLAAASEELAKTGKSDVLSAIATATNLTQYEVQQKIAEVSETIEPVELNQTYADIQSSWSAQDRFSFTSNLTTNEQKLRTIQKRINGFENRNSFQPRESFQQSTAYTNNGSAGDQLIDIIIGGEGGYDSVNRGTAGDTPGGQPGLSEKTLGEVMALQSSGQLFAVGAPQFIPETLKVAMKDAGLSPTDKFSPRNQRAMAMALMIGTKRPELAAYLNGTSDDLNAAHQAIANEWASIQGPSGRGSYDGDSAGNYASTSGDAVRQLLIKARSEISGK